MLVKRINYHKITRIPKEIDSMTLIVSTKNLQIVIPNISDGSK